MSFNFQPLWSMMSVDDTAYGATLTGTCCDAGSRAAARGALVREAQRGSAEALESSSAATGRARTGPPSWSSATPRRPRTSPRSRFSPRSGARPLRSPAAVRPWLHRIAVNRAIDLARARALRGETRPMPDLGTPRPVPSPPSGPDRSPTSLAALADLSPEHRAVVVLRYVLEYTPGEIAEALELPRGTVNSRLRRGLDRLAMENGGPR